MFQKIQELNEQNEKLCNNLSAAQRRFKQAGMKIKMLYEKVQNVGAKCSRIEAENSDLKKSRTEKEGLISFIEQEIMAFKQKIGQTTSEPYSLSSLVSDLTMFAESSLETLMQSKNQISELRVKCEIKDKKIDLINQDFQEEKERYDSLEKMLVGQKTCNDELQSKVKTFEIVTENFKKELSVTKEARRHDTIKNRNLFTELEASKAECFRLNEALEKTKQNFQLKNDSFNLQESVNISLKETLNEQGKIIDEKVHENEVLSDECKQLNASLCCLKNRIAVLETDVSDKKAKNSELLTSVENLRKQSADYEIQIDEYSKTISGFKIDLKNKDDKFESQKFTLRRTEDDSRGKSLKISKLEDKLENETKKVLTLEKSLDQTEGQKTNLEKLLDTKTCELVQVYEEQSICSALATNLQIEIAELREKNNSIENQKLQLERFNQQYDSMLQERSTQLSAVTKDLNSLNIEKESLEDKLQKLEAAKLKQLLQSQADFCKLEDELKSVKEKLEIASVNHTSIKKELSVKVISEEKLFQEIESLKIVIREFEGSSKKLKHNLGLVSINYKKNIGCNSIITKRLSFIYI